jgi:hypothetical protein
VLGQDDLANSERGVRYRRERSKQAATENDPARCSCLARSDTGPIELRISRPFAGAACCIVLRSYHIIDLNSRGCGGEHQSGSLQGVAPLRPRKRGGAPSYAAQAGIDGVPNQS